MKKLIFILIHFYLLQSNFGQDYIPFDFENGIWRCYTYQKCDCQGNAFELQYYAKGDTLINDTTYNKLYVYGYEDISIPHAGYTYFNKYVGAIANQVSLKTVRIIYPNETQTKIIYNFNLSIGDTISHFFISPDHLIVSGIDSTLFCNKYHKIYQLNDYISTGETLSIIEGIGFNAGLIEPWYYGGENTSKLECYTEKKSNNCSQCDLLLANNLVKKTDEIVLNYSNNILNIKSKNPMIDLKIFDISGKMIKNALTFNVQEYNLDLSKINVQGVIFIQIDSEEGRVIKKTNKINFAQQTVSPMPCYSLVSAFSVQMKLTECRK